MSATNSSAKLHLAAAGLTKAGANNNNKVELRTMQTLNFFSLLTFTRQPMGWSLIMLVFFESVSSFFQVFVPVFMYSQMWSYNIATGVTTPAPSLTQSQPPTDNPINTLIIAAVLSLTLFGIYMAMPGATGQWWFALEQWLCEMRYSGIYLEGEHKDKAYSVCLLTMYSIGKLIVAIASQSVAAFAAIHAVDALGEPAGVTQAFNMLTRRPGDSLIAIGLEAIMFAPFVVMFNAFYRTGPYGQLPPLANLNPAFNALLLTGSNFVGVLVLFAYNGSLMNFMAPLAISFTRREYSIGLGTQFVGHLVGGVVGWIFVSVFHAGIDWSVQNTYAVFVPPAGTPISGMLASCKRMCCKTNEEIMKDFSDAVSGANDPLIVKPNAQSMAVYTAKQTTPTYVKTSTQPPGGARISAPAPSYSAAY